MIEQTLASGYLELADKQRENEEELFAKENVVGVALGNKIVKNEDTGKAALHVLVRNKVTSDMLSKEDLIPKTMKGLQTDVIEVGEITAGPLAPDISTIPRMGPNEWTDENGQYQANGEMEAPLLEKPDRHRTAARRRVLPEPMEAVTETLQQHVRPVMGGYSVGHYKITAGTIATCAYDLTPFPGIPEHFYILSNNHVLANSNNARIGDPILQPGPYDGGVYPRDMIGRLSRFIPIRFKSGSSVPTNYVDAAIAEVPFHQANREIFWVGYVKDLYAKPVPGKTIVQKTGRTTNFTTAYVRSVNATIDVNYGGGRVARFKQQILTDRMSAGGDSGSLVTTLDEKAVGLLFAGSPSVTVLNNILYVQSLLRIRIHEF